MSNPIFSVIVPCYNVENYIEECLLSILNQTFENFELLIVDDCCTDNTMKFAEKFAKKDNRIKILKHEINKGLGAARNTALKSAKGKYIVCVDSDDYIKTDLLECVYQKFCSSKVEVIWFKSDTDKNNRKIERYNNYPAFNKQKEGLFRLPASNLTNFPLVSWNKAYSKDFLINNNIYWTEGKYFEDIEFFWKVHTKTYEIYVIDKCLYVHRHRKNSIYSSSKNILQKISDLYDVTTLVHRYLKTSGVFYVYKLSFVQFVLDTLKEHRKFKKFNINFAELNLKYLENIGFPMDYREV